MLCDAFDIVALLCMHCHAPPPHQPKCTRHKCGCLGSSTYAVTMQKMVCNKRTNHAQGKTTKKGNGKCRKCSENGLQLKK